MPPPGIGLRGRKPGLEAEHSTRCSWGATSPVIPLGAILSAASLIQEALMPEYNVIVVGAGNAALAAAYQQWVEAR